MHLVDYKKKVKSARKFIFVVISLLFSSMNIWFMQHSQNLLMKKKLRGKDHDLMRYNNVRCMFYNKNIFIASEIFRN